MVGQHCIACDFQSEMCKCSLQRNGKSDSASTTQTSTAEKPKRRRRRPEDAKSRGRTRPDGERALTSAHAAVFGDTRLPPLMPSALGLLASDPVFLVRAFQKIKQTKQTKQIIRNKAKQVFVSAITILRNQKFYKLQMQTKDK